MEGIKAGDCIFVSGKGAVSWGIQIGTLSLPNFGSLGRRGLAGFSHVGIVAPVFGELVVYESTSFGRPRCVRSGMENKRGVQAHHLQTLLDAGGDVWHYPLRSPLYLDEEERLLDFLELCLHKDYDFFSAGASGGGIALRSLQMLVSHEDLAQYFCSELVMKALSVCGIVQVRNASIWSPNRAARYLYWSGVCEKGGLIS